MSILGYFILRFFSVLVLLYLFLGNRQDQFAVAVPGDATIQAECRNGIPEVLIERNQGKIQVFYVACAAPVPDANLVGTEVTRTVDICRQIVIATVGDRVGAWRIAVGCLPVEVYAELARITAAAAGNVRELRNVVERAMIHAKGRTLQIRAPTNAPGAGGDCRSLRDVERDYIIGVLERTGWRVRGKGGAAEALDLKPTTLEAKMKRLDIRKPK